MTIHLGITTHAPEVIVRPKEPIGYMRPAGRRFRRARFRGEITASFAPTIAFGPGTTSPFPGVLVHTPVVVVEPVKVRTACATGVG